MAPVAAERVGFFTTRWSVVALGADRDANPTNAISALGQVCRTYWQPAFLFTCRRGYSPEDAQDLTQSFFEMVVKTNWLRHADRNRGRFRSLLLKSLRNFLADSAQKQGALKRGGGTKFVSWHDWLAEPASQLAVSAQTMEALAPEQLFDLRWAATVVEQALGRLREECERKGRRRLFDILNPHLVTERADVSYRELGTLLGVSDAVIKRQLHNLRLRYRWLLREEVARTVVNPADVQDEIRHLCAVLAAAS